MIKNDLYRQTKATAHYDKISRVYDVFSHRAYYHKARLRAVNELRLKEEKSVLNVPVGTGQNIEYLQYYLKNTGVIVDISKGMLEKAQDKIIKAFKP
ncbi:MAG: hypothetical protein L3J69_02705 [Desulfobacula sp.]|nr:hypothetical protein [Desulfobacula sp.]